MFLVRTVTGTLDVEVTLALQEEAVHMNVERRDLSLMVMPQKLTLTEL